MTTPPERLETARRAAEAGAEAAAERFRTTLAVEQKDDPTDLVTEADHEAQAAVLEVVREEWPDDAVVAEEDDRGPEVPTDGAAWIVDPVDGTNNFVRGVRTWATAVAAVVDGDPVAAVNVLPALGDVYAAGDGGTSLNGERVAVSDATDPAVCTVAPLVWWPRDERDAYAAVCDAIVRDFDDVRRLGSAQAVLSMVAAGQIDAAVTDRVALPWDTVGGVHLVRAAGGRVTDRHGNRWTPGAEGLVATNGEVHDAVQAIVAER